MQDHEQSINKCINKSMDQTLGMLKYIKAHVFHMLKKHLFLLEVPEPWQHMALLTSLAVSGCIMHQAAPTLQLHAMQGA